LREARGSNPYEIWRATRTKEREERVCWKILSCRSTWKCELQKQLNNEKRGVVYTAKGLRSFGYDVPDACFCGYHTESLEHLFFSCPLIQSGIAWTQSLLFASSPISSSLTVRHLLFGFSSDELLCVPRVFSYLLNVCKYLVWIQRNDYRFRAVPPSALGLLAALRSSSASYLPLFFSGGAVSSFASGVRMGSLGPCKGVSSKSIFSS